LLARGGMAVTREDFEALLARLADDREEAGRRYEDLRRRLVKVFALRRCEAPEEVADEAIDRVAHQLAQGKPIRQDFAYFRGVAHHVAQEMLREREREERTFVAARRLSPVEPEPDFERRLACHNACLARLPAAHRLLILRYYQGSDRIRSRQRLAHEL